jgi:hypothetical protein
MISLGYVGLIKIKAATQITVKKKQHKKSLQTFRSQTYDRILAIFFEIGAGIFPDRQPR